jgi:hypothetical protein
MKKDIKQSVKNIQEYLTGIYLAKDELRFIARELEHIYLCGRIYEGTRVIKRLKYGRK